MTYFKAFWIGVFSAATIFLIKILWTLPWVQNLNFLKIFFCFFIFFISIYFYFWPDKIGISSFLKSIHFPKKPGNYQNWLWSSVISFFGSFFGIFSGPEGIATSLNYFLATRTRAYQLHWFDVVRRTDLACSFAAGIAATFETPFAAFLFPLELKIGGKTQSVIVSALASFIGIKLLTLGFELPATTYAQKLSYQSFFESYSSYSLLAIALVILFSAGLTLLLLWFNKWMSSNFLSFDSREKKTTSHTVLTAAVSISLLVLILFFDSFTENSISLFISIFEKQMNFLEVMLFVFSASLGFLLVRTFFQFPGVIFPVFLIGAYFGYGISILFSQSDPVFCSFLGASILVAGVLGVPIFSSVLILEITQQVWLFVPCFFGCFFINWILKSLNMKNLILLELESDNVSLEEGRSLEILKSIRVKDVMVKDFTIAHEQETLRELKEKFDQSIYPFVVIVNRQSEYLGILTLDLLNEMIQKESKGRSILVARDLLYRTKFDIPTVRVNDSLEKANLGFKNTPVIPVLEDANKVEGLLFAYGVRIFYDKEVSRRAFLIKNNFLENSEDLDISENLKKNAKTDKTEQN